MQSKVSISNVGRRTRLFETNWFSPCFLQSVWLPVCFMTRFCQQLYLGENVAIGRVVTWLSVTVRTSKYHVLLVESRVCNWMWYTMFAWGWVCCCDTSGILSIFRRKLCAFENPSLKFSMNGRVGISISVPTLGHWILLFN